MNLGGSRLGTFRTHVRAPRNLPEFTLSLIFGVSGARQETCNGNRNYMHDLWESELTVLNRK